MDSLLPSSAAGGSLLVTSVLQPLQNVRARRTPSQLLIQYFPVVPVKFGKGSALDFLADFRHQLVVKIKVVQHAKPHSKALTSIIPYGYMKK